MRGVDVVVHAAALKQVPACEYNPFEAVQTNVVGAENVVSAAIENDVPLTIALSSDKAVNPVNLYGATKLCAEKIVTQGNAYAADSPARFASVRYGNVVGSRGSVIPLFKAQAPTGVLTITDERMTRFWITLEQAVDFVIDCLGRMGGGEIFVPRIPSMRVIDIAEALAPDAEQRVIGIRPGEKLHEVLLTEDESRHSLRGRQRLRHPPGATPRGRCARSRAASRCPAGFRYSSDTERPVARRRRAPRDGGEREGRLLTEAFLPYGRQEISDEDVDARRRSAPRRADHAGPARRASSRTRSPTTSARVTSVAFANGTAALHGAAFAAGPRSGRRGDHHAAQLRGIRELRPLSGRPSAVRRHLARHLEPRHQRLRLRLPARRHARSSR